MPVASFSDIAFLLIIYFLLATTLIKAEGLVTDMPQGEKSESEQMDKTPTVTVHDNGVRFNDAAMNTIAQLRDELAALDLPERADPEQRIVLLETSGRTDYQTFFGVVGAINESGGVIGLVETSGEGGD